MAEKNKVVVAIYKNRSDLENGVTFLKNEGFQADNISVLIPNSSGGSQEILHTKESKAPEGASIGAGVGAFLGGNLGFLMGIGALTIPGLGPFIAAGPIMATLAGIGIGGAVGGVGGTLIGLGIPEYEAKLYEEHMKKGGLLVAVHTPSNELATKAKDILQRSGGQDISMTTETVKGTDKGPDKGTDTTAKMTPKKDTGVDINT